MPVAVWSPTDRDIPPPPDFDVWTPEDRDIPPPPDLEAVSPFPASPAPDLRNTRTNAITGEQSVIPPPPPRDPLQRLPSMEDRFRAELATDPVMEAVLYPGILNDKGKWYEAVHYYQKNRDSIPKEFGEKFKSLAREIQPSQQLTRQEENELGVATAKRDLEQAWFPNIKAAAVQGGSDIDSIVARLIGANKTADDLVRMASEYEQAAEKIDEKSVIPKVLRQGARGAMRTLPAAAGAAMVAGPYGAIGYASATEANNAYTRGKDAGLAGNALTNYVASHAVIEAVPAAIMQRAGFGGLESFLGGKGAASKGVMDALKNLGVQTLQEVPEEVATELLHNLEDASSKVDPEAATPANLWKTAYQTTVQTLMTLGFANAPAIGVHSVEGAANFLNAKSRSDAEKLGYGRTSKADRAEMMRLALNYFQKPKEKAAAAESVGVLEAKEAEPDRDELLQWAEKQVAKPVEPPLSEGALPNAEQVQVPSPPDGGGRPQPEVRPEGGSPIESGERVQPSRQGYRDIERQAAPQEETVGQPAIASPVALEPESVAVPAPAKRSIYTSNPEHEALARSAAAGESIEKPEGISDARWSAMVKQAALPPVEPVEAVETPITHSSTKKRPTRGKKVSAKKQAEENARQFAVENGLDPDVFLNEAKYIHQGLKEIDDARREAKRVISRNINPLTIDRVRKRGGDYAGVRGFDTLTEKVIGDYPEVFGTELAHQSPNDAVWELATTKVEDLQPIRLDDPRVLEGAQWNMRPPTTDPMEYRPELDAYQTATDQFISKLPLAERAKAAREKFLNSAKILGSKLIDQNRPLSGIDPQYFVDAVDLVYDAARAGVLTFAEFVDNVAGHFGEYFDAIKPTLIEAWNREADRNPKMERAPVEESMDFDWETGTFMQGPVAPEKPAWKKTFEEAPEASQAEIFDVGRGDLPGQESLFEKDTMGRSQAEWEREQAAPDEPPPRQPPPPSEPQRTPGGLPRGPEITAARNAITEAITGIPHPPVDKTGHTQPELLERARKVPEREIDALIQRFKADPEGPPPSDFEEAILTVRLKRVREAQAKALESGQALAEAKATNDARELLQILKRGGTAAARSMAFRQANIEPDWSFGHMLDGRKAAKGDVPVTWEEKQDIARTAKNIEELEKEKEKVAEKSFRPYADKEVDKAIVEAEAELPPDYDPKAHALGKRMLEWSRNIREEGFAELGAWVKGVGLGMNPVMPMEALAKIGLGYLTEGSITFAEWSKSFLAGIRERYGEKVEKIAAPHVEAIWERSKEMEEGGYRKALKPVEELKRPSIRKKVAQHAKAAREEMSPEEQLADITKKLQKRLSDKSSVNYMTRKLMRLFAKAGIENREEMYKAVHNVFLGLDPNFTMYDVMGAVAGAGEWIPASSDKVDRQVANWRGEAQPEYNLIKLGQGEKTERFGRGRQLPTDEQRRLNRKLKIEIRKRNVNPEEEETQLRGLLQTRKTQSRHRAEDYDEAVRTGERIPKSKTPRPTDAELQQLEEREGISREAYLAKFEADIEIDRLEASIASVEDQIARAKGGEDIWKGKAATPKVRNERIDVMQADLNALKAERDAMKAANAGVQARMAEMQETAALRRIEELKAQLDQFKSGKTPEEKAKRPDLVSPETKAELARLAERVKAARKAMDEADLALWEGEGGALKQRVPISEERRLQMAIKAKNAYTLRKIADYMNRRAKGEFGPRPIKKPPTWPKETLDLMRKLETEKAAYERANLEWERKNRSLAGKALGAVGDVSDFARLIQTGFEMSAVARQGATYTFGFPEYSIPAIWQATKAVFSERLERSIHEDLANRENKNDYIIGKLETTVDKGPLTAREELVSSRLVDWLASGKTAKYNLPLRALLGSIRGFRTFCNIMRHDLFDYQKSIVERSRTWIPEIDAPLVGENANIFSGRAKMQHAIGWGRILYAPRWFLSRVQLAVMKPLWKGDRYTRLAAAKVYVRGALGMSLYFALRHVWYSLMADDEEHKPKYEIDPRSSDFGKMRIGNVRVDSSAGVGQLVTLGARLTTGENKNYKGEIVPISGPDVPHGSMDAWGAIADFARRKLGPAPSAAVDYLTGENAIGQPATPGSIVLERFTPITWRDIFDAESELGVKQGTTAALEAFFGMGVNTYQPREKKRSIRKRTR